MNRRTENTTDMLGRPDQTPQIPFELDPEYYSETYINGNITHFKQELADLFMYNPAICMGVVCKLSSDLQNVFLRSEQFKQAGVKVSLKLR